MKNEKLLKTLELEISVYALIHFNRVSVSFVNRVLGYLRRNMELLQDDNYKKLYDECILLSKWLHRDSGFKQSIHETVIDLVNTQTVYAYSKEIVEDYLKFRISSWDTGYYDKLFK